MLESKHSRANTEYQSRNGQTSRQKRSTNEFYHGNHTHKTEGLSQFKSVIIIAIAY